MRCPNCDGLVPETSRFCGDCGVNFFQTSMAWILRRALGAVMLGALGWLAAQLIKGRLVNVSLETDFIIDGLIVGLFLGVCPAIMEKSGGRALPGIVGGLLGGLLGGMVAAVIHRFGLADLLYGGSPEKLNEFSRFSYTLCYTVLWMVAGVTIGLSAAYPEPSARRLLAYGISGALGGAIAGAIGWETLGIAISQFSQPQLLPPKVAEAIHGGIIGGVIWIFIGLAERFSPEPGEETSVRALCKRCGGENFSSNRYCTHCGSHLRIGEKITGRRFGALRRIANGYRFFGRLSLAGGGVCTLVVFFNLLRQNVLLAFLSAFGMALGTYLAFVTFNAISETVTIFLDIEENTRRAGRRLGGG